ncbi:MAG: hypothetical protein M1817_001556 [Caeruleum heppii]|nr:MAG: hypothetical protein M1817_001556 [Caeruleum heppii]
MRQWEEERRFEELDSDDDAGQGVPLPAYSRARRAGSGGRDFESSRLRRSRSDLRRRRAYDSESAFSDDGAVESDDGDQNNMQIALRHKEDELVQQAMARMERAKLKGKSRVNLTELQLDALLRTQQRLGEAAKDTTQERGIRAERRPSAGRQSRDLAALTGGAPKRRSKSRRNDRPTMTTIYSSQDLPHPDSAAEDVSDVPARYQPSISAPLPRHPVVSQKSSRTSLTRRDQRAYEASRYGPYVENSRPSTRPPSSSRNAPQRIPMPHEADWRPRARAHSAAQSARPPDPFQYQTYPAPPSLVQASSVRGRRNVSGPAEVQYASVKRKPVNPSSPYLSSANVPASSSDPTLTRRRPVSSSIVTDSDDDDESETDEPSIAGGDDDEDDEESGNNDDDDDDYDNGDNGVEVTVVAPPSPKPQRQLRSRRR